MSNPTEWPADAPAWANYMATDADGSMFYYAEKPTADTYKDMSSWIATGNCKCEALEYVCPNWRDTLIERPKPVKQTCKCCGQEVDA